MLLCGISHLLQSGRAHWNTRRTAVLSGDDFYSACGLLERCTGPPSICFARDNSCFHRPPYLNFLPPRLGQTPLATSRFCAGVKVVFILNPQSGIPIYRQLVEQIRRMIAGGQLKPGDELPSVRELAVVHAINPMTISKAYSILETEGLLVRQRGKPMQVASGDAVNESEATRVERLLPQLEHLVLSARQLEISDKALLAALRSYLNQERTQQN
jgi:GntR family transcriptional regulator